MAKDLSAIKAAIKLVADAANDVAQLQTSDSAAAKIVKFQNLIPDVLALIPQIGNISAEIDGLSPSDYGSLLAELATDLVIPNSKIGGIVTASIKLIEDLVVVILPDVQAIIALSASAPVAAPAAGPAPTAPAQPAS